MRRRCLNRMQLYVNLAIETLRSEFPDFDIIMCFSIFKLDQQHFGRSSAKREERLQRLAQVFGVGLQELIDQFFDNSLICGPWRSMSTQKAVPLHRLGLSLFSGSRQSRQQSADSTQLRKSEAWSCVAWADQCLFPSRFCFLCMCVFSSMPNTPRFCGLEWIDIFRGRAKFRKTAEACDA